MQIGVIGSYGTINMKKAISFSDEEIRNAEKIGELLAEKGAKIICGGDDKGGLIAAVVRGAKRKNGVVVGVLLGTDKSNAMSDLDVKIVSGMGFGGREYLLPLSCDAVISIKGGAGTLNEVTVAYQNKIPVVAMKNSGAWSEKIAGDFLDKRKKVMISSASTPEEAVELAIKLAKERR